jgi:glycosyltransferase involved in cell wall biosynthesis
MKQSTVVICALARNVSKVLPRTIYQVTKLMDAFNQAAVVVFENDSTDKTVQQLDDWANEDHRVAFLHETFKDPVHPAMRSLERADRMAHYRNAAKNYAVKYFGKFDYAIVLDTDLNVGFSRDGVANTLSWSGWDVMGSNGVQVNRNDPDDSSPRQYDVWAFRLYGDWRAKHYNEISTLHFPRGAELEPVYSCFGGLAVYRMPAFKSAAYNGSDCEHVALHRGMRYNGFGRHFLNPSMICDYGLR